MIARRRLSFVVVVFAAAVSSAQAATISGRDRDNVLAACAQSHDTCLQSCNAAYPGTNVLAQGLRTNCQNGCNGSYSACINSVNLKATPIPQNKLPQNGKLFP